MTETPASNFYEDYQQASKLYEKLQAQATAENTATVLSALRNLKVLKVVVLYDGYGDEGEIGEVQAVDENEIPVALVEMVPVQSVRHDGNAYVLADLDQQPLVDLVKDVAGMLVEELHGGWENNDGAHGEVLFDLAEGRILIEHAARFTDEEHSTHEICL